MLPPLLQRRACLPLLRLHRRLLPLRLPRPYRHRQRKNNNPDSLGFQSSFTVFLLVLPQYALTKQ
jgi:hypothetical protein